VRQITAASGDTLSAKLRSDVARKVLDVADVKPPGLVYRRCDSQPQMPSHIALLNPSSRRRCLATCEKPCTDRSLPRRTEPAGIRHLLNESTSHDTLYTVLQICDSLIMLLKNVELFVFSLATLPPQWFRRAPCLTNDQSNAVSRECDSTVPSHDLAQVHS
jgi:hypothetical protein